MDAAQIVAEPGTLTGSIGVFAGKPVLTEFWQELGVNWGRVQRGANADHVEHAGAATASARRARLRGVPRPDLRARSSRASPVAAGCREDEVLKVAEGRVWTGQQAKDAGAGRRARRLRPRARAGQARRSGSRRSGRSSCAQFPPALTPLAGGAGAARRRRPGGPCRAAPGCSWLRAGRAQRARRSRSGERSPRSAAGAPSRPAGRAPSPFWRSAVCRFYASAREQRRPASNAAWCSAPNSLLAQSRHDLRGFEHADGWGIAAHTTPADAAARWRAGRSSAGRPAHDGHVFCAAAERTEATTVRRPRAPRDGRHGSALENTHPFVPRPAGPSCTTARCPISPSIRPTSAGRPDRRASRRDPRRHRQRASVPPHPVDPRAATRAAAAREPAGRASSA